MVMSALDKLLRQVAWSPLDYMIVDTPPGTGDTHLSLAQNLPIAGKPILKHRDRVVPYLSFVNVIPFTGALIVSTGQKASLQITRRGLTMFQKLQIPVVGIVHNMSSVLCTNCKNPVPLFGDHFEEFSKANSMFTYFSLVLFKF